MGIQKRRHSKARSARRRSQWRAPRVTLVPCPHCHQPMVPHRACPHCGRYAGRQVVQVEEEA
ncbi:MAG: 50S ribosomal protein L32 [Armatimonadota bacterium]|jgi:large subunit ribosomal protein L32|nr:50S ribosomal protein L32 [Armatimonadota bacterium]MDR7447614.1 50S ribosomal protein L32 [Armatimonadota bacterium]MDR7459505.1 50S ribosomal protein L32 [Armatimonadota bacterium]MDR7480483.1 50S ribosomal protein L32 [Armatimonadota bacterium]MDR7489815.1 50S ribosomal protein L32 [Armatimonadota bacterium]